MKFKVSLSAILLVLLGSGVLWAGDPWKEKPYTSWTEDDISKILSDSPWSKPMWTYKKEMVNSKEGEKFRVEPYIRVEVLPDGSRRAYIPPQQSSGRGMVQVQVRRRAFDVVWISSLTVREALVRRAILEGRATIEQGDKILATPQFNYVLVVQRRNAEMELLDISKERLMEEVYLELGSSSRRILPIEVMRYETTSGQLSELRFIFPRELNGQPTISAEEKEVRLYIMPVLTPRTFGAQRPEPIRATFHLRKMIRNGKSDR